MISISCVLIEGGSMALICPHCGHENLPGMDTCEACGQDLRHESIPKPKEGLQKRIMTEPIRNLRPSPPLLVFPEMPALEVIRKMQERQIGSALIVNEEGKLVGIFTDRDVIQKIGLEQSDLSELPIHALMTLEPVALNEEDTIAYALNKMSVGGFRHIPIVREGKPIGILTVKDLFHHLCLPESELEKFLA